MLRVTFEPASLGASFDQVDQNPPSFRAPEAPELAYDLIFDGFELGLTEDGQIADVAYIADLDYLAEKYEAKFHQFPVGECGIVRFDIAKLLRGEVNYMIREDESDTQLMYYNKQSKIVSWTYHANAQADAYYVVAKNIAIGVLQGKLLEVVTLCI